MLIQEGEELIIGHNGDEFIKLGFVTKDYLSEGCE